MERISDFQTSLAAKGYGHLGMGVAGALMLFAFCPVSFVAVAAPYWKQSTEMQSYGRSVKISAQVSLWSASVSTEMNGVSADNDLDMCSGDANGFEDCGKIHAVRFFTITALLLSLAAGLTLILGFSLWAVGPAGLRRKMSLLGVSLSAVVLLWNFLSICIAASVDTPEYSLNGAGFVFLVLELLFVTAATVLAVCVLTRWSSREDSEEAPRSRTSSSVSETRVIQIGKSRSDTSLHSQDPASHPTLLTVVCQAPAGNTPKAEKQQVLGEPARPGHTPKATTLQVLEEQVQAAKTNSEPAVGLHVPEHMSKNERDLKLADVEEDEKVLQSSSPLGAAMTAADAETMANVETTSAREGNLAEEQKEEDVEAPEQKEEDVEAPAAGEASVVIASVAS